jgi:arylsulfatase A-like enzyme
MIDKSLAWPTLPNFEETLIIITSDHGEHLGEKGFYGHQLSLYNELLWVPLFIKFPKYMNKRGVESCLVLLNDLYSTILDLVQSPLPCPETSVSLLSTQERELIISQYIYPEIFHSALERKKEVCQLKGGNFSPPIFAVITKEGLKIIESRNTAIEIFNLHKDPEEKENLTSSMHPERMESIRHLMEFLKKDTRYIDSFEELLKLSPKFIDGILP